MTGTLAVALAARKIPSQPDRLESEVEGFLENVDGKPLITRIKVHYKSAGPQGQARRGPARDRRAREGLSGLAVVQRGIKIEWDGEVAEDP